jgi:hypothetical protein
MRGQCCASGSHEVFLCGACPTMSAAVRQKSHQKHPTDLERRKLHQSSTPNHLNKSSTKTLKEHSEAGTTSEWFSSLSAPPISIVNGL